MTARCVVALAILSVAALPAIACSGGAYTADCSVSGACDASPDAGVGGTACPSADEARCCSDGGQNCASELMACRPKDQCDSVMPLGPCTSDEQCPGPPDYRCGVGRCTEGDCKVEIWASKAIPNQFPGDCKVTVCSPEGDLVVWLDPSDIPLDNNPCTFDLCEGDTPSNAVLPDKSPCPGESSGICESGRCKDCSEALSFEQCPDDLICDWDTCVPISCVNGQWDGEETYPGCGGSICQTCGPEKYCAQGDDCDTGVCEKGVCQYPSTTDGVKNGSEAGVDCGYPGGPPNTCNDGDTCGAPAHCKSGVCYLGLCQPPSCTDATKNGTEIGPDCGGECASCQK
jgi:hypothetical protein